jgi:hypothetical protein
LVRIYGFRDAIQNQNLSDTNRSTSHVTFDVLTAVKMSTLVLGLKRPVEL